MKQSNNDNNNKMIPLLISPMYSIRPLTYVLHTSPYLSLLYTRNVLGMEEKSSKQAISMVRTETTSQSSTTNEMLALHGLIVYMYMFSCRIAMVFYMDMPTTCVTCGFANNMYAHGHANNMYAHGHGMW